MLVPSCSQMTIYFGKPVPKPSRPGIGIAQWPNFPVANFQYFVFENRDGGWRIDTYGILYPDDQLRLDLKVRYAWTVPLDNFTVESAPTCSPSAQIG